MGNGADHSDTPLREALYPPSSPGLGRVATGLVEPVAADAPGLGGMGGVTAPSRMPGLHGLAGRAASPDAKRVTVRMITSRTRHQKGTTHPGTGRHAVTQTGTTTSENGPHRYGCGRGSPH